MITFGRIQLLIAAQCFLLIFVSGQLLKATNHQIPHFTKNEQGNWTGPYIFVQGSDPQPGLLDQIKGGNGSEWSEEIRRLKEAIASVNKITPRPGFFMITGDLVNAFPGEEPYRREQTKDVLTCLQKLQVPCMVISGNHDLRNTPTVSSIQDFRDQYGDDYYSFYYGGVLYIALNSQYFYDDSEVEALAQEQMQWLENQLIEAKSDDNLRHIVVFMHIPLFITEGTEENGYFNIHLPLRKALLNKFMDAGIKLVFTGHYHRNAGGVWSALVDGRLLTIESVVTSAIGAQLGNDRSGLRIVQVKEEEVMHKYYPFEDVPKGPLQITEPKNCIDVDQTKETQGVA